MWGETTRVENRGETTRGETTVGKRLGGETSCYLCNHISFSELDRIHGPCSKHFSLAAEKTSEEPILIRKLDN